MNLVVKPFYKQKTFWVMLAAIATAIGGYIDGAVSAYETFTAITLAVGGMFFRQGMPKAEAPKVQ